MQTVASCFRHCYHHMHTHTHTLFWDETKRGVGVYVPCLEMKPFQRSVIFLCFSHPDFVHRIDPKLLFLRPYHGSQRGRPNLILCSSNIPQSNITRLRSYHIQRGRAIFFHHSSLLFLFQAFTTAGPFCLSQGFPLLLDRIKGLQSSAYAQFHHEVGGLSKSILWGK